MLNFYKPTPKVTGTACSISGNTNDGSLFISMIKQASWDDQRKVGSFKASRDNTDKNINLKFNRNEIGAILDCIDRNRPLNTFHNSAKQKTGIHFQPFMREIDGKTVQVGFSLSFTKDANGVKTNFSIGFSYAEARNLREFLISFLQNHSTKMFESRNSKFPSKDSQSQKRQVENPEEEYVEASVAEDDNSLGGD